MKAGFGSDGKWNGRWTEYGSNGRILSTGKYKSDLKKGKWIYYDRFGKVKKVEWYKNGKIYKEKLYVY